MSDIAWIAENYPHEPKILMVREMWPTGGPYPPFLSWTMYMLDIDMVSSFVYVGTLHDLLIGNPSMGFGSNAPLPYEAHPRLDVQAKRYAIFVISYTDKLITFYDPDPIEQLILDKVRPNVYKLKDIDSSGIIQWTKLWESVRKTEPPSYLGYVDSSFTNWTSYYGDLIHEKAGVRLTIWQNASGAWMEVRGLRISQICSLIIVNIDPLGVENIWIHIYNSKNIRVREYRAAQFPYVATLSLSPGDYIWRIAIAFGAEDENRSILVYWIAILDTSFVTNANTHGNC